MTAFSNRELTPFNEWFDINKPDHLKAYVYLRKNESWPKHFIPADVEMEQYWRTTLDSRIVDAYLDLKTSTKYREPTPKRVPPEFS